MMNADKVIIGIDPGVKTGFATIENGKLTKVSSMHACAAEALVKYFDFMARNDCDVIVYIEDARLRKGFYGANANAKKQGAGSVKRDSQRWQEFCEHYDIKYVLVHPKDNKTKMKADAFKKLTGWSARTNEHGRDAAMLIFGRKR